MFNIDEFIPNFNLFVFLLTPMILLILFVMVVASKWFKSEKKTRKKVMLIELISYVPAIYLLLVVIEVYQYMTGERSDIIQRLFSYHFPIMMLFIISTGIIQVIYYAVTMGPAGEVSD